MTRVRHTETTGTNRPGALLSGAKRNDIGVVRESSCGDRRTDQPRWRRWLFGRRPAPMAMTADLSQQWWGCE